MVGTLDNYFTVGINHPILNGQPENFGENLSTLLGTRVSVVIEPFISTGAAPDFCYRIRCWNFEAQIMPDSPFQYQDKRVYRVIVKTEDAGIEFGVMRAILETFGIKSYYNLVSKDNKPIRRMLHLDVIDLARLLYLEAKNFLTRQTQPNPKPSAPLPP